MFTMLPAQVFYASWQMFAAFCGSWMVMVGLEQPMDIPALGDFARLLKDELTLRTPRPLQNTLPVQ
jgi:hypothetical protein